MGNPFIIDSENSVTDIFSDANNFANPQDREKCNFCGRGLMKLKERFIFILTALLMIFLILGAPVEASANPREIFDLLVMVSNKRCGEVVEILNERIPKENPDILMFAGDIHESGSCVDADWKKAAVLYERAAKAGAQPAIPRMIALYASSSHDPAAALWWAAQRPKLMPKDCIPVADPVKNAAAFVEELRVWSADQLKACVYHAGVMSRIEAKTIEMHATGDVDEVPVDVVLNLTNGVIEWNEKAEKNVAVSRVMDSTLKADHSSKPEDYFMTRLWWSGIQAIQEFGLPPSRDARWTVKNTFTAEKTSRPFRVPTFINVAQ